MGLLAGQPERPEHRVASRQRRDLGGPASRPSARLHGMSTAVEPSEESAASGGKATPQVVNAAVDHWPSGCTANVAASPASADRRSPASSRGSTRCTAAEPGPSGR